MIALLNMLMLNVMHIISSNANALCHAYVICYALCYYHHQVVYLSNAYALCYAYRRSRVPFAEP